MSDKASRQLRADRRKSCPMAFCADGWCILHGVYDCSVCTIMDPSNTCPLTKPQWLEFCKERDESSASSSTATPVTPPTITLNVRVPDINNPQRRNYQQDVYYMPSDTAKLHLRIGRNGPTFTIWAPNVPLMDLAVDFVPYESGKKQTRQVAMCSTTGHFERWLKDHEVERSIRDFQRDFLGPDRIPYFQFGS